MFDVIIRYKQSADKENLREIIRIASDYDWIGVNHDREGDFSLMMGEKGLDGFREKLKELDYVESVELRKY